ncbi:unnamed protein product [Prorocentrum cordatum]|uniref:Uncharacterized protein n=1 Tax=Prorocentrum cordatum TaxID=2364126 RepID=A0ABN9T2L0_9DINO|nr:unnamed protein product [Polarella glacialis]
MRSRPESTDLRSQPTPGMSERPDAPSPRSGRQSAALAAELRGLPGLAAAAAPSAEEGPARVAPSPSPRSRQAKEWLQSVSSQVDSARLLRARLRCAASPRMPKAKTLEMKALVSMERSLEDRMKGRSTTEKTLAASLAQRDDGMSKTGYSCEMCLLRMQKASAAAWTGLTMTERRQELRARLPEREQVRDEMQERHGAAPPPAAHVLADPPPRGARPRPGRGAVMGAAPSYGIDVRVTDRKSIIREQCLKRMDYEGLQHAYRVDNRPANRGQLRIQEKAKLVDPSLCKGGENSFPYMEASILPIVTAFLFGGALIRCFEVCPLWFVVYYKTLDQIFAKIDMGFKQFYGHSLHLEYARTDLGDTNIGGERASASTGF